MKSNIKIKKGQIEEYAVPLTGTETDQPIIGDLEMISGTKIASKVSDEPDGPQSSIYFSNTGSMEMSSTNDAEEYKTALEINPDSISVNSNFPGSKGIVSNTLFDKQNDVNAFAQLGDVTTLFGKPVSATQPGIVNNTPLQELGGVDKLISGLRVGKGASSTTAGGSTALGYQSLNSNTTGNNNTAVGLYSLYYNTTGGYNTAIGGQSLVNNTTGTYNTSLGYYSMGTLTNGISSVAIGALSMGLATSTDKNAAVGVQSLYRNTTGFSNVAFGHTTMENNTTGSRNTAVGQYSLRNNTTGASNVAIGADAGASITTGSFNTIIGSNMASGITTENSNVILSDGGGQIAIRKLSDNTLLAPTQTNSLIDADATGKAIITTEYADANFQPLDIDLSAIAALTTDSYGRGLLTQTSALNARTYLNAGDALLTQTITNGDVTHSPSGDVVFDALALKANLAGGNNFTGNQVINGSVFSTSVDNTRVDGLPSFTSTNENDAYFIMGVTAAGATNKYIYFDSPIANIPIVLNQSGQRVGIGTINPQAALDVNGLGKFTDVIVSNSIDLGIGNNFGAKRTMNPGVGVPYGRFLTTGLNDGNTTRFGFGVIGLGNDVTGGFIGSDIVGGTKFTNTGIGVNLDGTDLPTEALDINGSGKLTGNLYVEENNGTSTAVVRNSDLSTYAKKVDSSDIEITDANKGVILKAPDGGRWRITVSDTGTLSTTPA